MWFSEINLKVIHHLRSQILTKINYNLLLIDDLKSKKRPLHDSKACYLTNVKHYNLVFFNIVVSCLLPLKQSTKQYTNLICEQN